MDISKRNTAIRGFTFPELFMVLLILSIMAVLAIPKFISFREEAKQAVEQQSVRSVRVGISNYYIESLLRNRIPLYSETLDSASVGDASSNNPFFTNVLSPPGVVGSGWRKLNNTAYKGYSGTVYNYEPETGRFGGE